MTVHWAWGLIPSTLGAWYYGDTWAEFVVMTSMGTPVGLKAAQITGRGMYFGGRAIASGAWWLATRSATKSLGVAALRAGGSALAAVAAPVGIGYVVSYAIDENEGVDNFTDYLTGVLTAGTSGVTPRQYYDAVTLQSMR